MKYVILMVMNMRYDMDYLKEGWFMGRIRGITESFVMGQIGVLKVDQIL